MPSNIPPPVPSSEIVRNRANDRRRSCATLIASEQEGLDESRILYGPSSPITDGRARLSLRANHRQEEEQYYEEEAEEPASPSTPLSSSPPPPRPTHTPRHTTPRLRTRHLCTTAFCPNAAGHLNLAQIHSNPTAHRHTRLEYVFEAALESALYSSDTRSRWHSSRAGLLQCGGRPKVREIRQDAEDGATKGPCSSATQL